MDTQRKLSAALVIGVAATLLAWGLGLTGLLEVPEDITWDKRQRAFAQPVGQDVPIRVILLDEQSLEWARAMQVQWPWPYDLYTPIIRFCRNSGAKAIVFDVPFYDGGRYGASDGGKFTEAVAAGQDFAIAVVPGEDPAGVSAWPEHLDRPGLKVEGLDDYIASYGIDNISAERCRFPFEQLARGATMLGHITPGVIDADEDADRTIRRVRPIIRFDGTGLPALGLAAYLVGSGQASSDLRIEDRNLYLGKTTIPIGSDGRALLRYRKATGTNNTPLYRSYSAAAVIQSQLRQAAGEEPTITPDEFKDCYVFFALDTRGLHDILPTPAKPLSPGIEVHATFLDNLLNDGFIRDARWYSVLLFALLTSFIAAVGILWVSGWVRVMAIYLVLLPIPAVVGSVLFTSGTAWPIVWPMLGVGAALVGATVFSLATEGRQRRFIKRAFGHYLSPRVIERVLADPSLLQLGGERREVTVMFIDMEGFSSVAEKLDPYKLSQMLNHYLSRMSEAILEEDGTLDKFQGDAVMAFWNAPLDQPDHALRACRAALKCKEKIVGLRREWFDQTGHEPRIRIGIHTGTCVVGNMGAKQRFDYTVLGDTANLASRLEGVNKVFGTTVLVSGQTWDEVDGKLAGRGIARVSVGGRGEPIIVIEPYGYDPQVPHSTGEAFDEALTLCERGEFVDAMHRLHQLDQDPAARAYADKLATILQLPEPAWDGIWDLSHE
jgi:adenylate cyclase